MYTWASIGGSMSLQGWQFFGCRSAEHWLLEKPTQNPLESSSVYYLEANNPLKERRVPARIWFHGLEKKIKTLQQWEEIKWRLGLHFSVTAGFCRYRQRRRRGLASLTRRKSKRKTSRLVNKLDFRLWSLQLAWQTGCWTRLTRWSYLGPWKLAPEVGVTSVMGVVFPFLSARWELPNGFFCFS